MYVQETSPNVFTPVTATIVQKINGHPDTLWPSSIIGVWTEQQLADIGVYPVVPFTPPLGYEATGDVSYEQHEDGKVYEVYATKLLTVNQITRRQLILGLYQFGLISAAEAEAAAEVGAKPALVADFFSQLPEEQRVEATVTWASSSVIERSNPFLLALQQTNGLTDEQVDVFFSQFSQL